MPCALPRYLRQNFDHANLMDLHIPRHPRLLFDLRQSFMDPRHPRQDFHPRHPCRFFDPRHPRTHATHAIY